MLCLNFIPQAHSQPKDAFESVKDEPLMVPPQ